MASRPRRASAGRGSGAGPRRGRTHDERARPDLHNQTCHCAAPGDAGCERRVELIREAAPPALPSPLDVYVVHFGEGSLAVAMQAAEQCRALGLAVQMHCGEASLKSQMKKADQSGARFALLLGDDERAKGLATIKPMREEGGQETVALNQAAASIAAKKHIGK